MDWWIGGFDGFGLIRLDWPLWRLIIKGLRGPKKDTNCTNYKPSCFAKASVFAKASPDKSQDRQMGTDQKRRDCHEFSPYGLSSLESSGFIPEQKGTKLTKIGWERSSFAAFVGRGSVSVFLSGECVSLCSFVGFTGFFATVNTDRRYP
jgi:hypothetical protein